MAASAAPWRVVLPLVLAYLGQGVLGTVGAGLILPVLGHAGLTLPEVAWLLGAAAAPWVFKVALAAALDAARARNERLAAALEAATSVAAIGCVVAVMHATSALVGPLGHGVASPARAGALTSLALALGGLQLALAAFDAGIDGRAVRALDAGARARVAGWMRAAQTVGAAFVVPWLLAGYGTTTSLMDGLWWAVVIGGAAVVAAQWHRGARAPGAARAPGGGRRGQRDATTATRGGAVEPEAARRVAWVGLGAVLLCANVVPGLTAAVSVGFLFQELAIAVVDYARWIAPAAGLGMLLGASAAAWVGERRPAPRQLVGVQLALALVYATFAAAAPWWTALPTLVTLAVFEGVLSSWTLAALWGWVLQRSSRRRASTGPALSMAALNSGLVWGPLLGRWLREDARLSYAEVWLVAAGLSAATALIVHVAARRASAAEASPRS